MHRPLEDYQLNFMSNDPKNPPAEGETVAKPSQGDLEAIHHLRDLYAAMSKELGKVIIGQQDVIERLLICILARGHAL